MARFEVGNPGGPGRPPLDGAAKRTREIIREKLIPALPGILDRLLNSRHPRVVLESLRLLLPYIETREAARVDLKFEQREGLAERTFLEISEERRRRAAAAAASPPTSDADSHERATLADTSESISPLG
jgi:hypothetical protein